MPLTGGGGVAFAAGKTTFAPSLLPMSNASGVDSGESGGAGEGFVGGASL